MSSKRDGCALGLRSVLRLQSRAAAAAAVELQAAEWMHCKNIRISADILWRVFQILTEPVPCTFASVN